MPDFAACSRSTFFFFGKTTITLVIFVSKYIHLFIHRGMLYSIVHYICSEENMCSWLDYLLCTVQTWTERVICIFVFVIKRSKNCDLINDYEHVRQTLD